MKQAAWEGVGGGRGGMERIKFVLGLELMVMLAEHGGSTTPPCRVGWLLHCSAECACVKGRNPDTSLEKKIKIIRSRCTAPAMPGRFLFLHLCFFDLYFIFLVFVVVEHGSGTRWDRWYEEHTISLSAHASVGWLLYVVVKPGCKDLE